MLSASSFLFFFTLSTQFKFANNNYGPLNAIIYSLSVLPVNLYSIFPVLFPVGIWLAFYRLHSKGEMLQIHASGISPNKIASWVISTVLIWNICNLCLGEFAGPLLEKHAKKKRMQAMLDYKITEEDTALWLKEDSMFINAERTHSPNILINIVKYYFSDQELVAVEKIDSAEYINHSWHLASGEKMTLKPHLLITKTPEQNWKTHLNPELLKLSETKNDKKALFQIIPALIRKNLGLFSNKDLYIFWNRIFLPIKLFLISTWLCYASSKVCLLRLAQYTLYYDLYIYIGLVAAHIAWMQIAFYFLSFIPYCADSIACFVLICFIYYARHESMINVYSQK